MGGRGEGVPSQQILRAEIGGLLQTRGGGVLPPLVWQPLCAPPQIRELVPESQAYMDLLAFERKLDQTIMRKRVDIQEALKRPMKVGANGPIPGSGGG